MAKKNRSTPLQPLVGNSYVIDKNASLIEKLGSHLPGQSLGQIKHSIESLLVTRSLLFSGSDKFTAGELVVDKKNGAVGFIVGRFSSFGNGINSYRKLAALLETDDKEVSNVLDKKKAVTYDSKYPDPYLLVVCVDDSSQRAIENLNMRVRYLRLSEVMTLGLDEREANPGSITLKKDIRSFCTDLCMHQCSAICPLIKHGGKNSTS